MSKIRKIQKLPSCEINLNLLKELEGYIIKDLPMVITQNIDYIETNYSLSIVDDFGDEEINSIEKYIGSKFPDSIIKIKLYARLRASRNNIKNIYMENKGIDDLSSEDYDKIDLIEKAIPELTITINLKIDRFFSDDLEINLNGEQARARVIAIYDAIIRIFDLYKNNNYLYHPPSIIDFFILMYLSLLLPLLVYLINNKLFMISLIASSFSIIFVIYKTFGKKTHPYFLFDSKKFEKYKRWNNWFLYNVSFIILINIIFALLRKFNYF
jgi:hypothetical protein